MTEGCGCEEVALFAVVAVAVHLITMNLVFAI